MFYAHVSLKALTSNLFAKWLDESITHLFLKCPFGQFIWLLCRYMEGQIGACGGLSIEHAWKQWFSFPSSHTFKVFPLIICWGIWISRNHSIFFNESSSPQLVAAELMTILYHFPQDKNVRKVCIIVPESQDQSSPWDFFDGSFDGSGVWCGEGFILHISCSHCFHVSMSFG